MVIGITQNKQINLPVMLRAETGKNLFWDIRENTTNYIKPIYLIFLNFLYIDVFSLLLIDYCLDEEEEVRNVYISFISGTGN